MHHKRKRPANARAGCKLCKPWKLNGYSTKRHGGEKFSDHRRRQFGNVSYEPIDLKMIRNWQA